MSLITGKFSDHYKDPTFNGNNERISYGNAAIVGTVNNHPIIKAIINKMTVNREIY